MLVVIALPSVLLIRRKQSQNGIGGIISADCPGITPLGVPGFTPGAEHQNQGYPVLPCYFTYPASDPEPLWNVNSSPWAFGDPDNQTGLKVFTDGSKLNNRVGFRIACFDEFDEHLWSVSERLNDEATVFIAETMAVFQTIGKCQDYYCQINIYTDSRSVLMGFRQAVCMVSSRCRRWLAAVFVLSSRWSDLSLDWSFGFPVCYGWAGYFPCAYPTTWFYPTLPFYISRNGINLINNMQFSTKDKEYEKSNNCTSSRMGGWWYSRCGWSNPNGVNRPGSEQDFGNMNWYPFSNYSSLLSMEIKIRSENIRKLKI
ncbi:hypothetical protein AVEN_139227-1 [Araneus ventricosus]|uniref:Fibrinogen C-terminal domain-containing protein n=1 Tax=Araneus ventricosus TaxID=182803 RepID=A0A4Y2G1I8_ARAVE|nr:hypothetical protein AVEN_139227-1 [Araneus ventricosus]